MDIFSPYENYVLLGIGVYLLTVIFLFVKSDRLKEKGIKTKAKVLSIQVEESEMASSSEDQYETSYHYKAQIEFKTKDGQLIKTKIPIAKRYLTAEYKKSLPIIYSKDKPKRPMLNDDLYIYQWPIIMVLVFIVAGLVGLGFLSFGGV